MFIKGYIVERTNMAQLRPEEQIEKAKRCLENLWNEIQLKGKIKTEIHTSPEQKGVGKLNWFMSLT